MKKHPEAQIARAVSFEVGALDGAISAIIMRVEHAPLEQSAPDEGPDMCVFVVDRDRAAELLRQLRDALGQLAPNASRTSH